MNGTSAADDRQNSVANVLAGRARRDGLVSPAVCVTDDAIYVLRCNKLTGTSPKELVATLPRNQQLGPVSGLWGKVELLGENHWVHKRFHKDIEAADSAMSRA